MSYWKHTGHARQSKSVRVGVCVAASSKLNTSTLQCFPSELQTKSRLRHQSCHFDTSRAAQTSRWESSHLHVVWVAIWSWNNQNKSTFKCGIPQNDGSWYDPLLVVKPNRGWKGILVRKDTWGGSDPGQAQHAIVEVSVGENVGQAVVIVVLLRVQLQELLHADVSKAERVGAIPLVTGGVYLLMRTRTSAQ